MSDNADRALLQRFEPIIRYTRGERFFPLDVVRYVKTCSLWGRRPGVPQATCLIPRTSLTLETLPQSNPDQAGAVYFMKFADPSTAAELASRHSVTRRRVTRQRGVE